jgi:uncharacterized membrane protein YeaQ/YmgE (transglycosylase-associated protein family)
VGVGGAVVQRWLFPELHETWQFVILTLLGLVGSVIGTYLSGPADTAVLENFYKKTRPFGFWGPFKGCLSEATRKAMTREHTHDMIAIPFGLVWIVAMFLMPLEIIIRNWTALGWTSLFFLLSMVGLYKFWYLNLPPEPEKTNQDVKAEPVSE